jgi:hypothetical protein
MGQWMNTPAVVSPTGTMNHSAMMNTPAAMNPAGAMNMPAATNATGTMGTAGMMNMPAAANPTGTMSAGYNMPSPYTQQAMQPMMAEATKYQAMFPEVFYKMQPYIMMACDMMDSYGVAMPTREMVDNMSDGIYNDMTSMYPELAGYLGNSDAARKDDPPGDPPGDPPAFGRGFGGRGFGGQGGFDGGRGGFGGGFIRRGLPRDLLQILLLQELFNRRRNYY